MIAVGTLPLFDDRGAGFVSATMDVEPAPAARATPGEPRVSRRGPAPGRAERERDAGAAGKEKKAAAAARIRRQTPGGREAGAQEEVVTVAGRQTQGARPSRRPYSPPLFADLERVRDGLDPCAMHGVLDLLRIVADAARDCAGIDAGRGGERDAQPLGLRIRLRVGLSRPRASDSHACSISAKRAGLRSASLRSNSRTSAAAPISITRCRLPCLARDDQREIAAFVRHAQPLAQRLEQVDAAALVADGAAARRPVSSPCRDRA